MFSFEFWFVANAKLTDHLVIIMDGTMYFPPVYIKFRKQTSRGMEVDINIMIYKFSGIQRVLGSYSQGPCWCM